MDSRLIHVLLATWLAMAVAVGAVLGNGRPVTGHSHMLAFADNTSACPGRQALGCTTLYILNGDSVSRDLPWLSSVPATAKPIASPSDPIVGLAWAPDGNSIAYLVGRRAQSGNYYVIQSIDLWRVRIDDGGSELVAKDVASAGEREYRLSDAIQWIGDRPVMSARGTWVRAIAEPRESLSPDRKLVAARESGIDSNWICVSPPQSVQDTRHPGCFGDGFFSEPVWAPF